MRNGKRATGSWVTMRTRDVIAAGVVWENLAEEIIGFVPLSLQRPVNGDDWSAYLVTALYV